MENVEIRTVLCCGCKKLRRIGAAEQEGWQVCQMCDAGRICPQCWPKHQKVCKTLTLVSNLLDAVEAIRLDLGLLPDGEPILVDPSELCQVCGVGVQQVNCSLCSTGLCPSCTVVGCEVPCCAACLLNGE